MSRDGWPAFIVRVMAEAREDGHNELMHPWSANDFMEVVGDDGRVKDARRTIHLAFYRLCRRGQVVRVRPGFYRLPPDDAPNA